MTSDSERPEDEADRARLFRNWREKGDRQSRDELLDREGQRLRKVLRRAARAPELADASDFAQTAMRRILDEEGGVELHDADHLRARLVRIAFNKVRDHARQNARRGEQDLPSDLGTTAALSGVDRDDEQAWIREHLDGLKPEERQIIELRFFEGLSTNAIAERIGASRAAVWRRQVSALQSLMRALR